MTEIRPSMAYTVALFLICAAPSAVKSQPQALSRNVADDALKKSQEPGVASVTSAPGAAVDGKLQSAPALFRQGKFAEAERQFAWIAEFRKGTTWGERSQYYVAECQYHQKKYFQALEKLRTPPYRVSRDRIYRPARPPRIRDRPALEHLVQAQGSDRKELRCKDWPSGAQCRPPKQSDGSAGGRCRHPDRGLLHERWRF